MPTRTAYGTDRFSDSTDGNRSAACGAWRNSDGSNAHRYCDGSVMLPAPRDKCSCPCHSLCVNCGSQPAEMFSGGLCGECWNGA
jgi:hypothetical protein